MGAYATRRDVIVIGLVGILLGALLTAILMASPPARAADGDYLKLGRWNFGYNNTVIKGRGTLIVRNTAAIGKPAATFEVQTGPPISVNSDAKVVDLNADYLDSVSSDRLRSYSSGCATTDAPEGSASSYRCDNTAVSLPDEGTLFATGSAEVWFGTAPDTVSCALQIKKDGGGWTEITGSRRGLDVSGDNIYGICATDGWITIPAGQDGDFQVGLLVDGIDPAAHTDIHRVAMWWIYRPAPWGFASDQSASGGQPPADQVP